MAGKIIGEIIIKSADEIAAITAKLSKLADEVAVSLTDASKLGNVIEAQNRLRKVIEIGDELPLIAKSNPDDAAKVISKLPIDNAATVIGKLPADEAALVLSKLPADEATAILGKMSSKNASEIATKLALTKSVTSLQKTNSVLTKTKNFVKAHPKISAGLGAVGVGVVSYFSVILDKFNKLNGSKYNIISINGTSNELLVEYKPEQEFSLTDTVDFVLRNEKGEILNEQKKIPIKFNNSETNTQSNQTECQKKRQQEKTKVIIVSNTPYNDLGISSKKMCSDVDKFDCYTGQLTLNTTFEAVQNNVNCDIESGVKEVFKIPENVLAIFWTGISVIIVIFIIVIINYLRSWWTKKS